MPLQRLAGLDQDAGDLNFFYAQLKILANLLHLEAPTHRCGHVSPALGSLPQHTADLC